MRSLQGNLYLKEIHRITTYFVSQRRMLMYATVRLVYVTYLDM